MTQYFVTGQFLFNTLSGFFRQTITFPTVKCGQSSYDKAS